MCLHKIDLRLIYCSEIQLIHLLPPSRVVVLLNSLGRQPAVDNLICLLIAVNDIFNISVEDLYSTRPHFLVRIPRMLSKKVRIIFLSTNMQLHQAIFCFTVS